MPSADRNDLADDWAALSAEEAEGMVEEGPPWVSSGNWPEEYSNSSLKRDLEGMAGGLGDRLAAGFIPGTAAVAEEAAAGTEEAAGG